MYLAPACTLWLFLGIVTLEYRTMVVCRLSSFSHDHSTHMSSTATAHAFAVLPLLSSVMMPSHMSSCLQL